MEDFGTYQVQFLAKFCDFPSLFSTWDIQSINIEILPCDPTAYVFDQNAYDDIQCIVGVDC